MAEGGEAMMTRPRPRAPLDVPRSLWEHCIEGCLAVAGGVLLLAWYLPRQSPVWYAVVPMAVLTFVTWAVSRASTGSPGLSGWLGTGGAALTAWFAFAWHAGVWTAHAILLWVCIVFVLTAFGPPAIASARLQGQQDAVAQDRERQKKELAKWERHFALVGVRNIEVTEVVHHTTGWEVHGTLARATDEHGVMTFESLRNKAAEFDTHFRIRAGAVNFQQSNPDNAAEFVMHLYTKKGQRDTTYLPEAKQPATVNKPLELGLTGNGKPFRMTLLYIVLMVIGAIDAGKSNLLGIIIAQLARCEDVLIFAIDLKGGLMVRPWVQPWIEGYAERPAIDWIATTRREADLMLDTLLAAGDVRASRGAVGEKVRPRRDRPAVVLIVDETAVATSGHARKDDGIKARELAGKIARLAETYRAMAFVPVISAIRGDVETLSLSAIKAQAMARIGLRVSQSGDGDRIFPDNHAAAEELAKIRDPGSGLALLNGQMSPPVHFHRITPKIAFYRAIQADGWRPAPDPVLRAGLGDAYEGRWGNPEAQKIDECYEGRWKAITDLVNGWRENAREWRHDDDVKIGEVVLPARKRDDAPQLTAGSDSGDSDAEDYIDSVLREVVASVEDPEGTMHPARRRMCGLLREAGVAGRTSGWLAKQLAYEAEQTSAPELKVHRNTVIKWLREHEGQGQVRSKGRKPNDPYARWIWRQEADDLLPPGPAPDDLEGL